MATRKKPQQATAGKLPGYTGEQLADLIKLKAWIHNYAPRVLRYYANALLKKSPGNITNLPNSIVSFIDDCVHWTPADGPQKDIEHARTYLCFVATLIENNDYLVLRNPSSHYKNLVSDYEAFHPPKALP